MSRSSSLSARARALSPPTGQVVEKSDKDVSTPRCKNIDWDIAGRKLSKLLMPAARSSLLFDIQHRFHRFWHQSPDNVRVLWSSAIFITAAKKYLKKSALCMSVILDLELGFLTSGAWEMRGNMRGNTRTTSSQLKSAQVTFLPRNRWRKRELLTWWWHNFMKLRKLLFVGSVICKYINAHWLHFALLISEVLPEETSISSNVWLRKGRRSNYKIAVIVELPSHLLLRN